MKTKTIYCCEYCEFTSENQEETFDHELRSHIHYERIKKENQNVVRKRPSNKDELYDLIREIGSKEARKYVSCYDCPIADEYCFSHNKFHCDDTLELFYKNYKHEPDYEQCRLMGYAIERVRDKYSMPYKHEPRDM